ncbi:glycoside hydrolase family 3 N-terminal domain-containing protein [Erysipelothrix anatis]
MQNFGDYRYVDANGELTGQSYVNYGEGIYVGYRYYETRYENQVIGTDGVGDYDYKSTVKYPFGHGISYTEFTWGEQKLVEENGSYTMSVEVTNSGTVAGKDVIQLYAQTPYTIGGIEKSSVQLVGYAKTKELQPNEKEVIEIKFDQKDLASYDYIGEKTYVLDSGSYYITAAKNAHDAVNNVLSAKGFSTANGMDYDGNSSLVSQFDVAEKVLFNTSVTNSEITNQFDDVIAEDALYLSRSNWSVLDNGQLEYASSSISGVSEVTDLEGNVATLTISEALRDALSAEGYDASGAPAIDSVGYPNKDSYKYDEKTNLVLSDMVGLPFDDPKWDELLNAMKLSEQHGLFNKSGYGTAAIDSVGKPKTFEYDGPSGISNFITGESGFGFPTSTMVAATFNTDLAAEFGKLVGEDAINTKTSGWYAPAVNIHRTPFSGRNYEYYSEDPYLSGNVSLNVVKAVQDKGVYVYVKHFALNDQETNRAAYNSVATWSNEQAIREIYLKPFQMSIETGGAKGLMMSLNRIGSTHATTNYNLITNVTRGEWGFQGVIITDYMSGMSPEFADQFLAAGGDMFLATGAIPLSDAKQDWSRAELRRSSKNVLFNIANSLAMNGLTDGGTFSNGIAVYQIVLWIVDALVAFGLFISGKKVYTIGYFATKEIDYDEFEFFKKGKIRELVDQNSLGELTQMFDFIQIRNTADIDWSFSEGVRFLLEEFRLRNTILSIAFYKKILQTVKDSWTITYIVNSIENQLGFEKAFELFDEPSFTNSQTLKTILILSSKSNKRQERIIKTLDYESDAIKYVISIDELFDICQGNTKVILEYTSRLESLSKEEPNLIIEFLRPLQIDNSELHNCFEGINSEGDNKKFQKIYLSAMIYKNSFDFNNNILSFLLEKDKEFLDTYIDLALKNNIPNMVTKLTVIWSMNNYMELADLIFERISEFESKDRIYLSLGRYDAFFIDSPSCNKWIESYIDNKYNQIDLMKILFKLLSTATTERRKLFVLRYLSLNKDFSHFKQISILPMSQSFSGSRVPYIEKDVAFVKSIRDSLEGIDYLEHRVYFEDIIGSQQKEIKKALYDEYLERF